MDLSKLEKYRQIVADEFIAYESENGVLFRIDGIDNISKEYVSIVLDLAGARELKRALDQYINKFYRTEDPSIL